MSGWKRGNLELSAQSPEEIVQCHSAMIEWCKRKIEVIRGETQELIAAAEHAKKSKWKSGTLEKHAKLSEKRVVFYSKMLGALKAGYHVIPPMPVELIAGIAQGDTVDEIFDVTQYAEGVLRAEVHAQGDAFDLDDFAYTLVLPHRSKRVLVVTDGNAFLEDSIR
jgi:hypothetical protein